MNRGFEKVKKEHRKETEKYYYPERKTNGSAGYDLKTPIDFVLEPNEKKVIWTNIKSYMNENEFLHINVRSSVGIKKHIMLTNTVGVIDSDYFSNIDNDGNIGVALFNFGENKQEFRAGDRICQGVFMKYLTSDNGNNDSVRTGGIGSTNK